MTCFNLHACQMDIDLLQVFAKISNMPDGHLRSVGYKSLVYVDNSYLKTYQACLNNNILGTIRLLSELGFAIHTGKSVSTSSQTTTVQNVQLPPLSPMQY